LAENGKPGNYQDAIVTTLEAGVHNAQIQPVKGVKMKSKNLLVLVIGLVFVSLILGACSTSSKSNFPTGKFIKSGTTNYGLVFNEDGTFSVFEGDNTFVHGTYSVAGDIFTETSNDGGCNTNVNFKYSFDGKNLTLRYVGNPDDDKDCSGRYADFNNVTYALSK
jgi:hypothetical protein